MAILNVTPDSFYAGSRTPSAGEVERRVLEAVGEGASIIDVGGYSSRPGADEVPPDEEWRRVALGVEAVRRLAPDTAVSVDTFRSGIAARAIETFGPLMINDISAGELDPAMFAVAARYDVPYVAMHMKGDPQTMQSLTDYRRDIVSEVVAYFRRRDPPRTDRPRSRFRIRQDRGAELPPARRAARALCAGLPGARGAFAQVDDL